MYVCVCVCVCAVRECVRPRHRTLLMGVIYTLEYERTQNGVDALYNLLLIRV